MGYLGSALFYFAPPVIQGNITTLIKLKIIIAGYKVKNIMQSAIVILPSDFTS